jgi:histidinol-phosphate aminotransferase
MSNEVKFGFSRRSFMRGLGAASVAATSLPALAALQQVGTAGPPPPAPDAAPAARRGGRGGGGGGFGGGSDPDVVQISLNENPLGPSDSARAAIAAVGTVGGRYNRQFHTETVSLLAQQNGLNPSYVQFYPGSGGALDLAVYSSLLTGKDLVVGSPSYNQAPDAGKKMNVKVHEVPLTPTGAHDVKAMVAASKNVGCYYICNPCNPTGTMTSKADLEWLVKNKPEGSVVVIDEAYHHFSTEESSMSMVAADKDVIVLRTFSKVYGMAGLRAGFFISKPELHQKVRDIGTAAGTGTGSSNVSILTAAACAASLKDADLVPARRKINTDIRENVLEWMDKNGYEYMKGSQANFFQVNVKRPGSEFSRNMQKEKVQIGRTWKEMPNYVRITIGTQPEMEKFKVAFKKCYEMAPMSAAAYLAMPFIENPSELDRDRMYL